MSSLKAIQNINLFVEGGMNKDDFYRIFEIPFPNAIEIDHVIEDFTNALSDYLYWYNFLYGNYKNGVLSSMNSEEPDTDDNFMARKYEVFAYFSEDIFGNLATSIKLAGEGYIYESLAILRSAIDILYSSLFGSESQAMSINIMSSPYYHKLKEISLNEPIINRMVLKDENEKPVSNIINKFASSCLDNYLSELNINKEKINEKKDDKSKYIKAIKNSLRTVFAEIMNSNGEEDYKSGRDEIIDPDKFAMLMLTDDQYVYRACKEHEKNLLVKLQKQVEIGGDFDQLSEEIKNGLRQLTVEYDIAKDAKGELPTCDYCSNTPVIWCVHVRFNKRSMLKYLKDHLDKNALVKINKCTKRAFNGKKNDFFGDVIDYKIYGKLNPYSHGDPKTEPTITEWYESYMKPFLKSISCIYKNLVQIPETNNKENNTK